MKKKFSLLLSLLLCASLLTFTACGKPAGSDDTQDSGDTTVDTTPDTPNTPDTPESDSNVPTVSFSSALDFYTQVWDAFGDDNKFPAAGGDAAHMAEGPGTFLLTDENKETFKYLLHVTDALYDMLDNDVATLQHMMNTNTFSSAVVKLKDAETASTFAEDYKTAIQAQHWMCGFPDKVTVISAGGYLVIAYGLEDNITHLTEACTAVDASAVVLVDAPAFLE